MNQQTIAQRRGATVTRIPRYPECICGNVLRGQLRNVGKCVEVTERDTQWQQWLQTLIKQKWIMQVKFGYYARPRSSADLALAYHRRRTPEPGMTLARQIHGANQKLIKEMSCISHQGVINTHHE